MAKSEEINYNVNEAKVAQITTEFFVDQFLKLYSAQSNVRGIPFIGDGFKESQRKAIWGTMKGHGEGGSTITVERLSSLAAAMTDYHHGTGSMGGAIVGMAQTFPGSNNINFFYPDGNFGSRLIHASAAGRYIETRLDKNFRTLFKKDDDILLEQKLSNNVAVEPKYFIPLLPVVLLNGAEGMGTGHATHIFSYSPTDLKNTILKVLDGKQLKDFDLIPHFNGFKGGLVRDKLTGQITMTGTLKVENSTTLKITELPVGWEVDKYKAYLQSLEEPVYNAKNEIKRHPMIRSFIDSSDDAGFDFHVSVPRTTGYMSPQELMKLFKLEARDSENLTVWGPSGEITRYESPEKLLVDFVKWRLLRYEERRLKQIQILKDEIVWLNEVVRFINYYLSGKVGNLSVSDYFKNTGKAGLLQLLIDQKFVHGDKLLSMRIWTLTKDEIEDAEKKLAEAKAKLEFMEKDTADAMYRRELKELKFDF